MYYACTLTDNETETGKGLAKSSKAYDVLFGNYGTCWLASLATIAAGELSGVGIRVMQEGHIGQVELWDFYEGTTKIIKEDTMGGYVRAVVSLNNKVTVDASGVIS